MRADLLPLLRCPVTGSALTLENAAMAPNGLIQSGMLVAEGNPAHRYPVVRGVPRFVPQAGPASTESVAAFGDQWNHFNYNEFVHNFTGAMARVFGGMTYFKGKVVVDAGAGAGMQSRWIAEAGAKHVIALELSHAVDGVIAQNLQGLEGTVDVIQCSIDAIPLRDEAISGLVLVHNVIQHTPSVPKTLNELWRITGRGAELAFNSYTRNDSTILHRLRHRVYLAVRAVLARAPNGVRRAYGHLMSSLRFVPVLGTVLEKADLVRRGPSGGRTGWDAVKHLYRAGVLNTYDYFGAHAYQHHHSFAEIRAMVAALHPQGTPLNEAQFYVSPQPEGMDLRVRK